jgi:ATP-dependent Clp protease ATP-binding subunit ClpA
MQKREPKQTISTESFTDFAKNRIVLPVDIMETLNRYLRAYSARLNPEGAPVGSFILCGPTGVGKTYTVRVLAEYLHKNKKALIKIDCGEFAEKHEVAKLIGAPPGYLGHKETIPFITQHKLNSVTSDNSGISLLLFDEIEKAHPSLVNILLGCLDTGIMTLGDGSKVYFDKTMVFFTSNLGAKKFAENRRFGIAPKSESKSTTKTRTMRAVKEYFSPEFLNRISEIFYYPPLDSVDKILEMELAQIKELLNSRGIYIGFELTPAAKTWIIKQGFSHDWGARELRRVLTRYIQQEILTDIILGGKLEYIVIDEKDDKLYWKRPTKSKD